MKNTILSKAVVQKWKDEDIPRHTKAEGVHHH